MCACHHVLLLNSPLLSIHDSSHCCLTFLVSAASMSATGSDRSCSFRPFAPPAFTGFLATTASADSLDRHSLLATAAARRPTDVSIRRADSYASVCRQPMPDRSPLVRTRTLIARPHHLPYAPNSGFCHVVLSHPDARPYMMFLFVSLQSRLRLPSRDSSRFHSCLRLTLCYDSSRS